MLRVSAHTDAPWLLAEPLIPSPKARDDCAPLLPDRRWARSAPCVLLPLCWLQPYLQPAGARAGGEVGDAEWGGGKKESFLDEMPRHIV